MGYAFGYYHYYIDLRKYNISVTKHNWVRARNNPNGIVFGLQELQHQKYQLRKELANFCFNSRETP